MKKSEFNEFAQIISSVGELYGKTLTDVAISIWWNALKNLDLVTIKEALSAHVQNPDNGQFMPKPADVIKLLGGTTTDQAKIAWSKVDKSVRTVGTYRDIAFDDPIIHRVIEDMGGWIWFGSREDKEWPFVENNFIIRYRSYVISGVTEYPSILVGSSNAFNARQGFSLNPVYLFGNHEKTQLVIKNAKQNQIDIKTLAHA